MREIKFRLVKDGKIVGYEKHVVSCGLVQIFHSAKNDDEEGWEWWNVSIRDFRCHFIDHDHKDQFADLKDKNRREIYEGDIVRYIPLAPTPHFLKFFPKGYEDSVIRWTLTADYEQGIDQIEFNLSHPASKCEVIGNVHESPDLVTP